jgi:hypothetical protein
MSRYSPLEYVAGKRWKIILGIRQENCYQTSMNAVLDFIH